MNMDMLLKENKITIYKIQMSIYIEVKYIITMSHCFSTNQIKTQPKLTHIYVYIQCIYEAKEVYVP